jgi:hypothetical protein
MAGAAAETFSSATPFNLGSPPSAAPPRQLCHSVIEITILCARIATPFFSVSASHRLKAGIREDELLMATYLITGVAGFIGSGLARAVLAQGDLVRGIDNLSTDNRRHLKQILDQIDFREGDLLNLDAVHAACQGANYVLHQAAIPSVSKTILDSLDSNRANVDATVNLLVSARDTEVKRVV